MVDLPKKKVGIIACSGEELPAGTVTRLAALRVLEQLRPNDTVTICLPLFLAGGEGDRAFARFYPTISIDGCELRCAQKATEKYSHRPAASFSVNEIMSENQIDSLEGRRKLNPAGLAVVEILAEQVAQKVDQLLEKNWNRSKAANINIQSLEIYDPQTSEDSMVSTCACGSGIPVQKVLVAGREVTIVGLPMLLQQFTEAGKFPDDQNLSELFETVKIYNPIPFEEEAGYREGIRNAYTHYWFKDKTK
jgi:uncharacterized metal-binding protein